MAEYIVCRNCDSPDCKGCNLKNLETMLNSGKFDCLMNENRCINPSEDVAPVRHGRWERTADGAVLCTACKRKMNPSQYGYAFCSLCGAKMERWKVRNKK